ncbi:13620_t:CDS:2, partial [Entrophospora sp. SA101]
NLHQYFYHRDDIPSWLYRLSLKYGGVFEMYFGPNKQLMINDSRVVERVMSPAKDGNYFMRFKTKIGLDELDMGSNGTLFNVDFNSWSHIRKIIFRIISSPNALRFSEKLANDIFQDLEKLWDSLIEKQGQICHKKQKKSVTIDFMPWTKIIFAESIMLMTTSRKPNLLSSYYNRITNKNLDGNIKRDSNEEFLERFVIASDCVQYYLLVPPLIRNLPIVNTYTKYLYDNVTWTRKYGCELAKERRKEIENIDDSEKLSRDLLNMLLTVNTPKDITQGISNDDNEKPMTDQEVGDTMIEIISEGIDSPSNALGSILYCVGNNPDVEQRIIEEIETVLGNKSDSNITHEDLNKLEYIEAVIKEVLRIRPATATISRFSANSDQIDEYTIPASTQLAINIMGLQMNPKYWEEPTKFNPSRFLASSNNNEKESYNKNAFVLFGGGLRVCPGSTSIYKVRNCKSESARGNKHEH